MAPRKSRVPDWTRELCAVNRASIVQVDPCLFPDQFQTFKIDKSWFSRFVHVFRLAFSLPLCHENILGSFRFLIPGTLPDDGMCMFLMVRWIRNCHRVRFIFKVFKQSRRFLHLFLLSPSIGLPCEQRGGSSSTFWFIWYCSVRWKWRIRTTLGNQSASGVAATISRIWCWFDQLSATQSLRARRALGHYHGEWLQFQSFAYRFLRRISSREWYLFS